MALSKQIKEQIESRRYQVFSCYDFLTLASYRTINKTLERMADSHVISRLENGLFSYQKTNPTLGIKQPISQNEIVKAIARKYRWKIAPAGASALNEFGLSTQVPYQAVYVSTGPYKKVQLANYTIIFKHTYSRTLSECSPITASFAQALRALGKSQNAMERVQKAFQSLPATSRRQILKEASGLPVWMATAIHKAENNAEK